MASLTLTGLDEAVERRIAARAAEHGRSIEEEAKAMLAAAIDVGTQQSDKESPARYVADLLATAKSIGDESRPAIVSYATRPRKRTHAEAGAVYDALKALGRKSEEPFDQKAYSDALWDFVD